MEFELNKVYYIGGIQNKTKSISIYVCDPNIINSALPRDAFFWWWDYNKKQQIFPKNTMEWWWDYVKELPTGVTILKEYRLGPYIIEVKEI
jgi:hypothetical protein